MAFATNLFIKLPSSLSSEWSTFFRFHDKISFLHTLTFPCQKGWDPPGLRSTGWLFLWLLLPLCLLAIHVGTRAWIWNEEVPAWKHSAGLFISPPALFFFHQNCTWEWWEIERLLEAVSCVPCKHICTNHLRAILKAHAVGMKCVYAELLQKCLHQVWREGRDFFLSFATYPEFLTGILHYWRSVFL